MSRFVTVDRGTDYLLPPPVEKWLPAGHLARFVVEMVERMDLSALTRAAVDVESMLIVAHTVTRATNDKQQVDPMVAELQKLPESVGSAQTLLAATGYFNQSNVKAGGSRS